MAKYVIIAIAVAVIALEIPHVARWHFFISLSHHLLNVLLQIANKLGLL
jgi:hypothetical protein